MNAMPKWITPFAKSLASEPDLVTALLAFAAGDAFGVYYEFLPRNTETIAQEMRAKEGWPFGGVSDDTLLTLLTLASLSQPSPEKSATHFLNSLRANASNLRGLGPTTRTALDLPVRADERGEIGNTNGAIMRTAVAGIFFSPAQAQSRRAWIEALVKTTHKAPKAIACAQLTAALFSRAGEPISLVLHSELKELAEVPGEVQSIGQIRESWTPSAEGTSLDPLETLLAVLWVVESAQNCADAYSLACSLGGDTDTVAALAGALTSLRKKENHGLFDIEWLQVVQWTEIVDDIIRVTNIKMDLNE